MWLREFNYCSLQDTAKGIFTGSWAASQQLSHWRKCALLILQPLPAYKSSGRGGAAGTYHLLHNRKQMGSVSCRSCAGNLSCGGFLTATVVSHPEKSIPQHYLFLLPLHFPATFSSMLAEPGRKCYILDAPFMDECSIVTYSQHLDQL